MSDCVLVFTRYPVPGRSKTRLISALGEEGAADLHSLMAERTVRTVREFCGLHGARFEIWHEGGDKALLARWLGEALIYRQQCRGDLGRKMRFAFSRTFDHGAARAVLVGTDCPALSASVLRQAFKELETQDVVLGPARDGGYYLIGLGKKLSPLFKSIPWGSGKVLEATRAVIEKLQLTSGLLETLSDVDTPEDLPVWENASKAISPKRVDSRDIKI